MPGARFAEAEHVYREDLKHLLRMDGLYSDSPKRSLRSKQGV
jgi:hypothetical protein